MLNEYYDDINSFTYNGKNSLDMGLMIEAVESPYGDTSPVLDEDYIPGKGKVIYNSKADPLDNEEFNEFEKSYKCYLLPEDYQDVEMIARNIFAWLYQNVDYSRLDDTYEAGYYRMAVYKGSVAIKDIVKILLGEANLTFTCKPFKFAYEGERTLTLTKPNSIYNTEGFTAKPYIKIYGSGAVTLYINDRAHSFNNVENYIEVDSELQVAYKGDVLQNNKMTSTLFPKLAAGENKITWAGNVTKLEIIPRWCCL